MKAFIRKDGSKVVEFPTGNDQRKTLYLPKKMSKAEADRIAGYIRELAISKISGDAPSIKVANWLSECEVWMRRKLAKYGLAEPLEARSQTLGELIDNYLSKKTGVKQSTLTTYKYAKDNLLAYFGAGKLLTTFNGGDAEDFRNWFTSHSEGKEIITHSVAYVNRVCRQARTFFDYGVKKKYIGANPFGELKGLGVNSNPARKHYVDKLRIEKLVEHCDEEFAAIIALARFGGMRCPSEILNLRWSDINWQTQRINFRSPKTAHHAGKAMREIPLFPTLRPYLEKLPQVGEFVIANYRWTNTALREELARVMKKAGLEKWAKPFNNLRASCRQDLRRIYKLDPYIINSWMGHSSRVGDEHYDLISEEDFLAITGGKPQQNPQFHPLPSVHTGQDCVLVNDANIDFTTGRPTKTVHPFLPIG